MESSNDDTIPKFNITPEQLETIRDKLGIDASELPADDAPPPTPIKRRRGRPRKYPISETGTTIQELAEEEARRTGTPVPPAKLTKRDEKDVSERIANMLMGGTGILSQAKSYLAMTEDEARAISDPLGAYLVRNADTIPVANQILENYDLLAITLGVLAYVVRIYRERSDELAANRADNVNTQPTLIDRIRQRSENSDDGQTEGTPNIVSTPYS
jgi:hypothetical protein